ncbi:hypothetical protein [Phormidium sp. CCY1219]|uniref:hypothetical protein n=1 Tax=Phormidium sp. CCY1219 TaxID=2886104 RepID=UPI002D1F50BC|nr:hypothetical protein [Phormidium sp. CCY1219]MEB3831528.1 hypothetical protein [Phormidium sp. CCY1219]
MQLYDSYCLYLNLGIPELDEHQNRTQPVDVSIINKINQNQQFILESSIGQVVILTGWLSKEQQQKTPKDWQKLADRCVQSFLEESGCTSPLCYQANQLFGSPVFEYGDPRYPDRYNTIWVWLFFDESKDTEKPSAPAELNLVVLDLEFLNFFIAKKLSKILK